MISHPNADVALLIREARQVLNKTFLIIFQTGNFLQVVRAFDCSFEFLLDITIQFKFDHQNGSDFALSIDLCLEILLVELVDELFHALVLFLLKVDQDQAEEELGPLVLGFDEMLEKQVFCRYFG